MTQQQQQISDLLYSLPDGVAVVENSKKKPKAEAESSSYQVDANQRQIAGEDTLRMEPPEPTPAVLFVNKFVENHFSDLSANEVEPNPDTPSMSTTDKQK